MTPDQIISNADIRTERRGKVLDLQREFLTACVDFCMEQRWYWRRKRATISTVAGTATYDLTDSAGANAIDCEQICKGGVRLVRATTDFTVLPPLFSIADQDAAIDDTKPGEPSNYFMDPGSSQTIRFYQTPGGAYTIKVSYWAVPNTEPDQLGDTVPLVPSWLHPAIQARLEARIFQFALGEGSAKYVAANQEYQNWVAKAGEIRDFEDGRQREWVNTNEDESVRSTL